MHDEPIMDVAHLAHLEILTPKPEQSLRFFVDVMGMTESGRQGDSVYLRAWDDYERYSLQLTASKTSGLGHAAFRARSPQALQRRVQALQGSGNCSGRSDWLAHAVIGNGVPWSVRRIASMARIALRRAGSTTDRISA